MRQRRADAGEVARRDRARLGVSGDLAGHVHRASAAAHGDVHMLLIFASGRNATPVSLTGGQNVYHAAKVA